MPYSLSVGMVSTLVGLLVLAVAPSYPRDPGRRRDVWDWARRCFIPNPPGGAHGFGGVMAWRQSVFPVGGNTRQALSP